MCILIHLSRTIFLISLRSKVITLNLFEIFYTLRHILIFNLHNQTHVVRDTLSLSLCWLSLIPLKFVSPQHSFFSVTKHFLTETTICLIGHTSQLKKYSKIQFIPYLSYFETKKIEITFVVSETLIATISFHPLFPNLVQLRETMAKSKSKKKRKVYILNSLTLFDFQEFSKSLTFFYVFLF